MAVQHSKDLAGLHPRHPHINGSQANIIGVVDSIQQILPTTGTLPASIRLESYDRTKDPCIVKDVEFESPTIGLSSSHLLSCARARYHHSRRRSTPIVVHSP